MECGSKGSGSRGKRAALAFARPCGASYRSLFWPTPVIGSRLDLSSKRRAVSETTMYSSFFPSL